jgi:cytochrome c nitrite reductase small subunit
MISARTGQLLLVVAGGILFGLGGFTLQYGEGLSYFSKNPAACANCHIMNSQYDSWQKSSHHTAATCVDCHLPHDFIGKYLAKAENGYNHSRAFTMQDFAEPIRINEKNSRILQANCLACHGDFVHELVSSTQADPDGIRCVHCHRSAGHGVLAGLGGPEQATEKRGE